MPEHIHIRIEHHETARRVAHCVPQKSREKCSINDGKSFNKKTRNHVSKHIFLY